MTQASPKITVTAEEIRAALDYDPQTGVFTWRRRKGRSERINARYAGKRAGVNCRGYIVIRINEVLYRAHRLAWLYVYGAWPGGAIDHINGNPSDNRIANLREATLSENQYNRRIQKNNTSGTKGVTWVARRQCWQAQIAAGKSHIYVGSFKTKEQAAAAYAAASAELHGKYGRIR